MMRARAANLLGAVVLGLTDEIHAACTRAAQHGGEAAAALTTIGHEPGLTNQRLSHILGLSHAGTVRLVDKLVADGLVERRPAREDGRAVALRLTPSGKKRRMSLLTDRQNGLVSVIGRLTEREQAQLSTLLEKILVDLPRDEIHGFAICRLCEDQVCVPCPIESARYLLEGDGAASDP
jgi:MarR family transcriptional repressor of emrRAB